jgi:hypothetical protein
MPALLTIDVGLVEDGRSENGIQIYAGQIQKVLLVAAGYGIDGLIGEGHGVEEGIHGALQQFHKRLLHRVLIRAAEHGMLQNMEYAGVILRNGFEADAEKLVGLLALDPGQFGAGLFIDHFHQNGVLIGDGANIGYGEVGNFGSDLHKSYLLYNIYNIIALFVEKGKKNR